jgi:hypothetical protein
MTISLNGGPALTPDVVTDATWSTTLTGLKAGNNTITMTATPIAPVPAPVATALIAATNVTFPSGILTGGASASVTDALRTLKIVLGIVQATDAEKANGDVAPLINGLPAPDGKLDVADVVVTLRKAVGLENF